MDILPRVKDGSFAYTAAYLLSGRTVDNLMRPLIDASRFNTTADLQALRRVAFNLAASKRLGWPDIVLFSNAVPKADEYVLLALERAGVIAIQLAAPGRSRIMAVVNRDMITDDYSATPTLRTRGISYLKTRTEKRPTNHGQGFLDSLNEFTDSLSCRYTPSWATKPVALAPESLRYDRIFINDFETYGRFTAPFQSLSKADRATIWINGQPTCECDFTAMHPMLLYAAAKADPPADLYRLPGIPASWRPYVKLALLISINARDPEAAATALASRVPPDVIVSRIMAALRKYHAPIAKYFWSNSGIKLMYLESEIAEGVMRRCMAGHVPVLGMHDGFICRRADAEKVKEMMAMAFREVTGYTREVKVGVK